MDLHSDLTNDPGTLKDVPKRTNQLGLMTLALSMGISFYYFSLDLYFSSAMVSTFSLVVMIILLLKQQKVLKEAQVFILAAVCALLVVSAFVEGSVTGQYFYFYPLLVVIPVIVDYKKSSTLEFVVIYTVVIISFITNFYVGHAVRPFETIDPFVASNMLYTNASSAVLLTLSFSIAYIYYERKYLKAIMEEKNNAIAARTKFLSTMGHELRTPLN